MTPRRFSPRSLGAVSRRWIATHAQLIGRERMLLLRSVSHDQRNPLNTVVMVSTESLEDPEYDLKTRNQLLGTPR